MKETLVVHEIYASLQGESTFAGLPCVFIRLTGCNLRCSWCDTAYAFHEGHATSVAEVLNRVHNLAAPYQPRRPLVELTGGEPLLQPAALPLMTRLCDSGYTVLLETSGAMDISPVDSRVHRIMDLKCPASGESHRNRWENLAHLKPTDEIKVVIATREDYAWAVEQLRSRDLHALCPVLFSWASPLPASARHPALKPMPGNQTPLSLRELADRIIADALPVRLQLQMHKIIWSPEARGV